jgi:hypothetical protein
VIAGANIRSVRMSPGVDFFDELERAVRESYPKPKMMILGFPPTRPRNAWSWNSSSAWSSWRANTDPGGA